MPQPANLAKAKLCEIWWDDNDQVNETGKEVPVQFNPQTLALVFSNNVTGESQSAGASRQFVGRSSTRLTLELWFDVTAPLPDGSSLGIEDVRELTKDVVHFVTPKEELGNEPPGIRFIWGTFLFDGIVTSINETLELFSEDGKPLRSKINFSISKQEILGYTQGGSGSGGAGGLGLGVGLSAGLSAGIGGGIGIGGGVGIGGGIGVSGGVSIGAGITGSQPLVQVSAGATIQGITAGSGKTGDWKEVALANNIENPRRLNPGTLINANASASLEVE